MSVRNLFQDNWRSSCSPTVIANKVNKAYTVLYRTMSTLPQVNKLRCRTPFLRDGRIKKTVFVFALASNIKVVYFNCCQVYVVKFLLSNLMYHLLKENSNFKHTSSEKIVLGLAKCNNKIKFFFQIELSNIVNFNKILYVVFAKHYLVK